MRFSFIFLFFSFSLIVKSQQQAAGNFLISGQLKNASGATIYLEENPSFKEVNYVDSVSADRTGKFSFKGTVSEPTFYLLRVKNKPGVSMLILENLVIDIRGNADSLSSLTISGSNETEIFNKTDRIPEIKLMDELFGKFDEAQIKNDVTTMMDVQNEVKQLFPKSVLSIKDFISTYPTAYGSVGLLYYFISIDSYFPDLKALDDASTILNKFKTNGVSNNTQLAFLEKMIQSRLSTSVGRKAPEILQPDTTGTLINLSSLKGKYVLIDFWASWCFPCRKGNEALVQLFKTYGNKNFVILSVSIDENRRAWTTAIKKDGMTWMNVSDLKANLNEAKLNYGVQVIPANFLIDPNGIIIAKSLREDQLEKELKLLIK